MPLTAGSRVGSCVVVSLIGEGGMGEVYRARDTTLDRDVAIKRLLDAVVTDPERLARFEREAKTLAALNHPNVAQIYAVESGTIVMELVPGETVRGPLPLDTALDYARQIASALDAAHERGIVHRDLKPGNVMVTPEGVVKVLDFGLAARERTGVDGDPSQSPTRTASTATGLVLGTAAYMAPEQASGKPVDKRADIFSFGVVLWEMLTGRRMFEGETISHVLAAVLTQEPDLTLVPPSVRPLLARCLEKDPRKRLRDIGDAMSLVLPLDSTGSGANAAVKQPRVSRALGVGGWVAAALAVAVASWAWLQPTTEVETNSPVVRFRIARALDIYNQTSTAFAVSPDGLTLAHYDAAGDGRLALFIRTLATGEAREVPGSQTFNPRPHSLFWSPDGTKLVRGVQQAAEVVDVSSGASRRLCECAFIGGTWNRDGVILLGSQGLQGRGIRRVSLSDPAAVEITTVEASRGEQDTWPVFLPDGRRFLFTRTAGDGRATTYLGTLDGQDPRRLVDGSRRIFVPPAGGRAAYLVGIDTAGVVAEPIDPDTMTVKAVAITLVTGSAAVSGSPNGVLAASAAGARPQTAPTWFDRNGAPLGRTGEAAFIESVALSHDGSRVALARTSSGGSGTNDIWVRDLTKGVEARLTFNPGNDSTPVWSPDGTRISYSSMRDSGSLAYQRTTDGTGRETPLFSYDRTAWPNDWSSDGRFVIVSIPKPDNPSDNDLWTVPIAEGVEAKPVLYLAAPGRQQQAQFSPDGRFVAYGSDESGAFEIFVQPFPDPSLGKWMVTSGGGVEPRWSRDGTELFYFSGQTLMRVPVALKPTFSNGAPTALFDAAIQAGYTNDSHRWQVAPDGKRFLLLPQDAQQQAPPLDVIVNWPALLRK